MLRKHVELSQYHFSPRLSDGKFKITLACFILNDVALAIHGRVKKEKSKVVPVPNFRNVGDWKYGYYSFPNSTLHGGECLYSRNGRFTPGKKPCISIE
jgi:hypothetical protein